MNQERPCKETISDSLKLLAATHIQAIRQLEETLAIICRELELQDAVWPDSTRPLDRSPFPPIAFAGLIVDRTTLSVIFRGKTCFLGNTLLFRFLETIARRPNRYFSHTELLEEVWGGPRSDATIRNVAKRLRDRLNAGGLSELAAAIDGKTPGHYVLLLSQDG